MYGNLQVPLLNKPGGGGGSDTPPADLMQGSSVWIRPAVCFHKPSTVQNTGGSARGPACTCHAEGATGCRFTHDSGQRRRSDTNVFLERLQLLDVLQQSTLREALNLKLLHLDQVGPKKRPHLSTCKYQACTTQVLFKNQVLTKHLVRTL